MDCNGDLLRPSSSKVSQLFNSCHPHFVVYNQTCLSTAQRRRCTYRMYRFGRSVPGVTCFLSVNPLGPIIHWALGGWTQLMFLWTRPHAPRANPRLDLGVLKANGRKGTKRISCSDTRAEWNRNLCWTVCPFQTSVILWSPSRKVSPWRTCLGSRLGFLLGRTIRLPFWCSTHGGEVFHGEPENEANFLSSHFSRDYPWRG